MYFILRCIFFKHLWLHIHPTLLLALTKWWSHHVRQQQNQKCQLVKCLCVPQEMQHPFCVTVLNYRRNYESHHFVLNKTKRGMVSWEKLVDQSKEFQILFSLVAVLALKTHWWSDFTLRTGLRVKAKSIEVWLVVMAKVRSYQPVSVFICTQNRADTDKQP